MCTACIMGLQHQWTLASACAQAPQIDGAAPPGMHNLFRVWR